jgi:hypothetical protein
MTKSFQRECWKALCCLALIASCASGQWLNYPSPGIPRLPDGKPNLTTPAPKTADGKPDLSGVWDINTNGDPANDRKPGDVLPWAEALAKERQENLNRDDPSTIHCLPDGPRFNFLASFRGHNPLKIVQTPSLIVILGERLAYRQVFMDGRELPSDPNPDFMGYSVGHWEGDTLVIVTAGYNDRTWLFQGLPHTESLRTVERFHRKDFGHLEITETFDDPKAFARPWTVQAPGNLIPDSDLLENVCNENNKDIPHLVGKASDLKSIAVEVAPEILAKYPGVYAGTDLSGFPIRLEIFLSGRELSVSVNGNTRRVLTPVSNTKFLLPQLEFLEENGEVVAVNFSTLSAAVRVPRVREGK